MKATASEALAVRCPRCLAKPKKSCLSVTSGRVKLWPHSARRSEATSTSPVGA